MDMETQIYNAALGILTEGEQRRWNHARLAREIASTVAPLCSAGVPTRACQPGLDAEYHAAVHVESADPDTWAAFLDLLREHQGPVVTLAAHGETLDCPAAPLED